MSQEKPKLPQPIPPGSALYRLLQLAARHMAQRRQPENPSKP